MSSLHSVEIRYSELLAREDRMQNQNRYNGKEGGVLFIRYVGRYRDHFYKALGETSYISPVGIWNKLSSEFKKNIKIPRVRYDVLRQIWYKLLKIDNSYNTEDGQIRWLLDNGFNINLGQFWSVIPSEVSTRMDQWQRMNLPLKVAKDVRRKLQSMDNSYNTEDGQIRWLLDNEFDIHLGQFWSVIPSEIHTRMYKWQSMNLPLEVTKDIRKKLQSIDNSYNSEDGQIRWLVDNRFDIHLGHFWGVIPGEIRRIMDKWQKMNLSLEEAKDIRKKLQSIGNSYNTEDGQIRWLQDNEFDINLGHFWSIIPDEIRRRMDKWQKMNLPLEVTKDVRKKLKGIDNSYNTEDGQIRWLEDNNININLGQFWSVIQDEVCKEMDQWQNMNLPLEVAKDVRKKLQSIDNSYNTEDGQIRWLEDNKFDINLSHFWSVIPSEIRTKMDKWKKMDLPLEITKDVRKKLENINNSYNTEDGQIRWLEEKEYDIHLGHFWSVITGKVLTRMDKWQRMNLPLEVTKDVRKKLKDIDNSYNAEDGQIRWLEDNGFVINLSHFWSVIPSEVLTRMDKWQYISLPLEKAKNVIY